MSDQAAAWRALVGGRPRSGSSAGTEALVIASGKGGVGKSVLAIRVACTLAAHGRRTLLLDGAQDQGNLHVLLGLQPGSSLEALHRGEVGPDDVVLPVREALWLAPADSGSEGVYALTRVDRARLHQRLCSLYDAFDAVVVDAGAGLDSVVRVAAMRAQRLVAVTVPEPAALADTYALLKIVSREVPALPLEVFVNRAAGADEALAVWERIETACRRFLGRAPGFLGFAEESSALRDAVRHPGRLAEITVQGFEQAAETLLGGIEPSMAPGPGAPSIDRRTS